MGWIMLSVGVLTIGFSLYLFLGIAYPFIAFYQDTVLGIPVLFGSGLFFLAFGSYLCWESITKIEDRKVEIKINKKRKKKLLVALES